MSILSMLLGVRVRQRLRPRRDRAGPAPRLTDAQVLEARHLHERHGYGATELLRHFGLTVTKNSRNWMQNILSYRARSSPTKPLDPSIQRSAK